MYKKSYTVACVRLAGVKLEGLPDTITFVRRAQPASYQHASNIYMMAFPTAPFEPARGT